MEGPAVASRSRIDSGVWHRGLGHGRSRLGSDGPHDSALHRGAFTSNVTALRGQMRPPDATTAMTRTLDTLNSPTCSRTSTKPAALTRLAVAGGLPARLLGDRCGCCAGAWPRRLDLVQRPRRRRRAVPGAGAGAGLRRAAASVSHAADRGIQTRHSILLSLVVIRLSVRACARDLPHARRARDQAHRVVDRPGWRWCCGSPACCRSCSARRWR